MKSATFADRFWSRVNKTAGCWEWAAANSRAGYGVLRVQDWYGRRLAYAHRIAYSLTKGFLPDTLMVCHRCDNPKCVRPEHLFLGTAKDNTQDSISKGRFDPGKHSSSKTHCPKGHPYDLANTHIKPGDGARECRECRSEQSLNWQRSHPESIKAANRKKSERWASLRANQPGLFLKPPKVLREPRPVRNPKTHCPKGHPYDASNTRINRKGLKLCRACGKVARRSWFKAHPEKVKAYNRTQYEKRVRLLADGAK